MSTYDDPSQQPLGCLIDLNALNLQRREAIIYKSLRTYLYQTGIPFLSLREVTSNSLAISWKLVAMSHNLESTRTFFYPFGDDKA